MSTLRQRSAAMTTGYRTAVPEMAPAEPDAERRAEQKPKRRRAPRKRATIADEQLSPETKEPSPE